MQPARKTRQSCLLDVPQPWLLRLFTGPYLDSDSKLKLFRTCRSLSQMALRHSNSTTLSLDLLSTPTFQAFEALQMASRHSHNINLQLCCNLYSRTWQHQESDMQAKLRLMRHASYSFLHAALDIGVTDAVQSLQIEGTYLKSIVPPIVGQACPNVTKLVLTNCRVMLDLKVKLSDNCPQLQSLELQDVAFQRQGPADVAVDDVAMFYQHLKADLGRLTAVQSLAINRALHVQQDQSLKDAPLQVLASLAGRLTHLCWNVPGVYPSMDWILLNATLQHLQLPCMTLDDGCIRTLLKMPHLTHVQVRRITLRESFAGQPCTWQQLTLDAADILVLARLPLHSGLLLKVEPTEGGCSLLWLDHPTDTEGAVSLEEAQQAVINVRKCLGVDWGQQGVFIPSVEHHVFIKSTGLLSQALLLLEGVTALTFARGHLDEVAMQALCTFVSKKEGGISLNFECKCTWEAEDMLCLIPKLPHGSMLRLHTGLHSLELITQLCCAARRKLELHACCCGFFPDDYMQHICTAMGLCGHQHVDLHTCFLCAW